MKQQTRQQGFTLFEMVIVLVIIALLVGAIMVARELINNSRIRSAIGQIEQYNGTVGTFRTKFSGLPGDLVSSSAQNYGLTTLDPQGAIRGYGDGNGKIESAVTFGESRTDLANGEPMLFWKHLSETKMVPSGLDAVTQQDAQIDSASESEDYERWMPEATIRNGVFVYLYAKNAHFFYMAKFTGQATPSIATATTDGFTQWESKTLDDKLDDGFPTSGRITAVRDMGATEPMLDEGSTPAASVCVDATTTPKTYYQAGFLDRVSCRLSVRAAF